MDDVVEHILIDDFPLKWRFAGDASKWTVLPPEDLARFRPLTEQASRTLWTQLVADDAWHHSVLSQDQLRFNSDQLGHVVVDDDAEPASEHQRIRDFLTTQISLPLDTRVLFFWGATCSVDTTWDVFIRYWDDFCYPLRRFKCCRTRWGQQSRCISRESAFHSPVLGRQQVVAAKPGFAGSPSRFLHNRNVSIQ